MELMGATGRLTRSVAGAAALVVLAAGCSIAPATPEGGRGDKANKDGRRESRAARARLIGDGSTASIGAQPNQP
ncbi:hypothetical protein GCM10010405_11060 [Streptomyces macrosporus]|uniref:Lipoprotein n=1 Tax=Streptomyces macrosporus TaxID=44032 RepID=A0ABP5WL48_9ACTN